MKAGKRIGYVLALAVFLILTLGPFIWTVCHAGICNDGEEYEIAAG